MRHNALHALIQNVLPSLVLPRKFKGIHRVMSSPQFISSLSEIAENYDLILCDVWGVIHNGREAFKPACDALMQFRENGRKVSLITNAPVPEERVRRYFEPLGVPNAAFDICVSSGDITRDYLQSHRDQNIWRLGEDGGWAHDKYLVEGIDLKFTAMEDAEYILCIGTPGGGNSDPESCRELLAKATRKKLEMICANPDIQVRVGNRLYWCAGALARIFEEEGGKVIYAGKPYTPIYDHILQKIAKEKYAVEKNRCLCIGDSPATDLRGAENYGMDSLYVGTGLKNHTGRFEEEVESLLNNYKVVANYAIRALTW